MTQHKPTFEIENSFLPYMVMGIDEVGYGAWAGPVVVGAAALVPSLLPEKVLEGIHDSKSLSLKKREEMYMQLTSYSGKGLYFCITQASSQEVDALNVLEATHGAMIRAEKELLSSFHDLPWGGVLVDGISAPQFSLKSQCIVEGDRKSLSIATASILAKVTRDHIMRELSKDYSGYGWDKNVGYGTALHQEGLRNLGATPHHRMSYKPLKCFVREAL